MRETGTVDHEPAAGDPSTAQEAAFRCGNCGVPLHGEYCHRCGQQDLDLERPFFGLLREWLGNILAFDARLWRTLGPLLVRPGRLTVEYLAGRRVHYVPPLRLYLFASVAMFLALAWSGYSIVHRTGDDKVVALVGETPSRPSEPEDASPETAPDAVDPAPEQDDPPAAEEAEGWIAERLAALMAKPDDVVNELYRKRLAQTLILLVFIFALLTRALFWRPYRRYFPHLVLAIHVFAAAFTGIVVTSTLGALARPLVGDSVPRAFRLLLLAYLLSYGFVALRCVFGRGRFATLWRYLLLCAALVVALALTLLGTMILAAALL